MIGVTDLTGQNPIETFQNLVTTAVDSAGTSSIYNATGSQISYLNVTTSFARSASYEIIYEDSASYSQFSTSGSYSGFAKSASFADFTTSSSYAHRGTTSSYSVSSSWSIPVPATSASYVGESQHRYGSIFAHNVVLTIPIAATDVYYRVSGSLTSSFVNGILWDPITQTLSSSYNGKYLINWSLGLDSPSPNQEMEATVFVNTSSNWFSGSTNHVQLITSGRPVATSGTGIIYIDSGSGLGLCVNNQTSTANIIVAHANLSVVYVGP